MKSRFPRQTRLMLGMFGLLLIAPGSANAAHPIVAGFERFHSSPKADPLPGGQLLLGELNCTSCHASSDPLLAKKQAPILDGISTRVKPAYLKRYLADPQAEKPGTTMPHVLANDPDKEQKVAALAALLASTGPTKQLRPDLKAVIRGRDLFAKVGCASCHGLRDINGEPAKNTFPHAVPLGNLSGKYSIPGLTTFLNNPLAIRPSGRMPHLLKTPEASDVAHYLLQGAKVSMPTGKGTTAYSYFEGDWNNIPDFAKLKPKATGTGVAFDISPAKRAGNFGLRFVGYINIEAAGEYTLTTTSDDGSNLYVDDKLIVNNDGVHPPQSKSGSKELIKGIHKITVDFFQGGGGAELDVEIEGRNLGRQPLAPLMGATEADVAKKAEAAKTVEKDEDAIPIDKELVAKGKTLFASEGCANCHQLKFDGKLIASTKTVTALDKLKGAGGCLDGTAKDVPAYSLSDIQKKALLAALPKPVPEKTDAASKISQTMLTFNCYACHVRDKVGGVIEATNTIFQTTQPEMGDEGRVPPPLDGVGAKLNPAYVAQILNAGAHDRPYMHTRMPGFGTPNVGHLTTIFDATDKLPEIPPVKFAESDTKIKAAGRQMVGAQAFGCIKCHTFAGNKAEGVQGIDMTLMTKRLKRDWFHAYCIDPQKIRPGTRMPTAWPNGVSTLPSILDGKASTQVEAILTYLASDKPAIPAGLGKKFIPLVPTTEAIIYRNFIQGAGARGIGVGYPEKLNIAFDANEMRLAMIWQGGFIDAARHWTDRGVGFEGPLGDNILPLPAGPTFATLERTDTAWPAKAPKELGYKFLGYTLSPDERPTFKYAFNDIAITDFSNPVPQEMGTANLKRTLTLESAKPAEQLFFRAAVGNKIEAGEAGWFKMDGYKIKVETPGAAIRTVNGKQELVVPVNLKDGKAVIVVVYSW
ncbi:PA14 domain-containing protein [Zavarzinella formosa]|uniref:PA14 domain-containing protein n=1 Tax=Zavarzinella formosa TaxID=360055 RepID=UPI0012FC8C61|nr:PA14 domain-containing protein [Zavarzinella formosa]